MTITRTKSVFRLILQVIFIVVLVEAAYWISGDMIVFNEDAFNKNLEFLYYTLPAITALLLTIFLYIKHKKYPPFISNFIIVLINTYSLLCILMITSGYCDFKKNLDLFYSTIVALMLIGIAYILGKKIVPEMSIKNLLIVVISTIIAFYDFLISLIGYQLLYPGSW